MRPCIISLATLAVLAVQAAAQRTYHNTLTPIKDPKPLLADYPQWVEPVREAQHFEAPILVDDEGGDLEVRAWRFSYNARGIIEMPNRLRAAETAVICVHPWGIDDGQGWVTPQPAGVCDMCTPWKNRLASKHTSSVIKPFLKSLRGKVGFVMYSLPGEEDEIRRKLYRSFTNKPTEAQRAAGAKELEAKLRGFDYSGEPVAATLELSTKTPVIDYFKQFPGLDAGERYNGKGYWDLPIPICNSIDADPEDVVIYDSPGYAPLKQFLQKNKIRHVLLVGYATDMCYCKTTAGYENLSRDFDVFLVGDATLATFPANDSPRSATTAAICKAAMDHLITQISWIKFNGAPAATRR